ncbi:hypothetical protein P9112_006021 [Eukaryota sp. TZLM1-RC]
MTRGHSPSPEKRDHQCCSSLASDDCSDSMVLGEVNLRSSPTTSLQTCFNDSCNYHSTNTDLSCHDTKDSFSYVSQSTVDGTSNQDFPQPCSPTCSFTDTAADLNPDRSALKSGVKSLSSGFQHTLLLTYSGEVYSWGYNDEGQVLFDGPRNVTSPIKLPFYDIVSISAGHEHSLALSSEGKLFGWGSNTVFQINMSEDQFLPITLVDIPFNIKEVYGGENCSFALTQEGQVIKWGYCKPFEIIEDLNNIVFISFSDDSVVAVDENGDFFVLYTHCDYESDDQEYDFWIAIALPKCISPKKPSIGCFLLDSNNSFYFIDTDGFVWMFDEDCASSTNFFDEQPTKISGLSDIISISAFDDIYAAVDNNGKVYVWGGLSEIPPHYQDHHQPICIDAFTNIEGDSVGYNFLFAYNKNTVWAWGRNDKGQLGTGDHFDRLQPVKVFGSEILGRFQGPCPLKNKNKNKTNNKLYHHLVKLIYAHFLNLLKKLFGNFPYTKARFYTKCSISRRVAGYAKEVINGFEFLKNPQDLNLYENISDLQLRLSTNYYGPKVVNTRIKKLDFYYDKVPHDPQLLSFFPNVEVVKLCGEVLSDELFRVDFVSLSKLKWLEIDFPIDVEQLPTSLVKLVLNHYDIELADLSNLTTLKELVITKYNVSQMILSGAIPLPQSIVRLEVHLGDPVLIEIQLANLEELIVKFHVPNKISEQKFPSLKFIQLIGPDEDMMLDSTLSPTSLIKQGLIKSVKLIKNEYLVELSCFPWWVQHQAQSYCRYLIDAYDSYVDEFAEPFHW